MSDNQNTPQAGSTDMGLVMYICYAAGLVSGGLATIVGVVIAYMQREQDMGTWRESHDTWLIRTFWIGLAAGFISFILSFLLIGFLLMPLVAIWFIVRLVKGWMAYDKKQPIPDPDNLLFG